MNEVLRHIEEYNFKIEEIKNSKYSGYYCKNETSNIEFILTSLSNNFVIDKTLKSYYQNKYNENIEILNLIEVNDNIEEVVNFIEKPENTGNRFLIYDKEDELEFFLKDLWNMIISLND